MNQMPSKARGVTLLEIMLVLAVAAMVIVMSIRYYQSAQSNQGVNETMSQIQAIASGMDNIAKGGAGKYTGIDTDTLKAVVGENNMVTFLQKSISLDAVTDTTYTITLPLNEKACLAVKAKLTSMPNITTSTCSSGDLQYTYDSTVE